MTLFCKYLTDYLRSYGYHKPVMVNYDYSKKEVHIYSKDPGILIGKGGRGSEYLHSLAKDCSFENGVIIHGMDDIVVAF